ncbi:MAG: hypothetical protein ACP5FZ_10915 [Fidelibacterota bacterium]
MKIVYFERFTSLSEAKLRENQIKSYKGGEAFKKLIGFPGSSRLRRDVSR